MKLRALLLSLIVLAAAACGAETTPTVAPTVTAPVEGGLTITLGDVSADEPVKKINRFQPLADYLAAQLGEFGIQQGRVKIAPDIPSMALYLSSEQVDVYFDSAYPTLAVTERTGARIILRRWKGGDPEYWSVLVARRDSGIEGAEGLLGRIVAFEEQFSTSGYVLPAGTLVQRGLTLRRVSGPEAEVAPDEIGYVFSRDEENMVRLVVEGRVAGGGMSNQDLAELPPDLADQLVVLERTFAVPRQLVSVRPGLDPALEDAIRELLIGLSETAEGRALLERLAGTARSIRCRPTARPPWSI